MTLEKIRKYIVMCNTVLHSNDVEQAQKLTRQIISESERDAYFKRVVERYSFNDTDAALEMLNDVKLYLESFMGNVHSDKIDGVIYVCHSEKDEDFARHTIDLLIDIGIDENNIISTSIENYTIPLKYKGNRYDYMRSILESGALVLFLLTNHTYTDPVCMMEMGAVWMLKNDYYSIVSPDFNAVPNGAINPRTRAVDMSCSLSKIKVSLGELREMMESSFSVRKISDTRWEEKRDKYIKEIKTDNSKAEQKSTIESDADKVVEKLGDKKVFTVTAVTTIGYTYKRSKEILDYLTKIGKVKKETVGRYSWGK